MFSKIRLTFIFIALLHQRMTSYINNRVAVAKFPKKIASKNDGLSTCVSKLKAVSPNDRNDRRIEKNIFFGFTDKAEVLNGRIAMVFFSLGIYEEFVTGKSILEQIGFSDHSQQISGLEVAAFFGTLSLLPTFRKLGLKLTSDVPSS